MNIFFHPRVPLCFVDINTLYFRRTLYHIVTLYLYICAALRCKSWDTCITLLFYAVYKEFVTQLTELPPLPRLLFNHGVETVLQRLWPVYHNSELFNVHPHPSNSFLEAFQVWYARCISSPGIHLQKLWRRVDNIWQSAGHITDTSLNMWIIPIARSEDVCHIADDRMD